MRTLDIPEGQINTWWQTNFHSTGTSAKLVFHMLAYPDSAIMLCTHCALYTAHLKSKQTSELKICIKLPGNFGNFGMSEKAKKQVVSTHDQCLAHPVFFRDLHF